MRHSVLSTLKRSTPVLLSMGLGGLVVVGAFVMLAKLWPQPHPVEISPIQPEPSSTRVAALSFQPAVVRQAALDDLARQGTPTEQNQARYVLAADAIRQQNGTAALQWLDRLDLRYVLLAPDILVLRAQAYALMQQQTAAQATWKQVIDQFPNRPAAGRAYYALGQNDSRYWDRAIATLPTHPRTVDIAVARLKQNPKDRALLMLIAQSGLHLNNYRTYLDQLTTTMGSQLTPQDWQKIGFGYWEKQQYKAAGLAYSRAPGTSRNAYRAARGLQLGEENKAATAAYQRMIAAFPQAPETPRALFRLADLTDDSASAITHLDQSVTLSTHLQRPEDGGDALARKARRLQTINPAQQTATEAKLLEQFGQTEAAADLRWNRAWHAATAQQFETAQQWAMELAQRNPDSDQAPKALFWAGKWAERLSNANARQAAFAQLWQRYPESYYAWRVGTLFGVPVGDFQSLRAQTPVLAPPNRRLPLSVGSAPLRELYNLGEGQAAWERWQLEFQNRERPSIAEQLTDGLVRTEVGEYLDGLFMLGNLRDRVLTEPENQSQRNTIQALRQDRRYWQALYPTPYWAEIQRWSRERTLNPVLVLALMRQESRFMPAIQSTVGATGLMQLMPETAAEVAAQLKLKTYRLDNPRDNIRLGTWYLNSTHAAYQDNSLLAIASYNAGPGNVDEWTKTLDLQDADVWIESIPFDETQAYVKHVLENYWNYLRLYSPQQPQPLTSFRAPSPTPKP